MMAVDACITLSHLPAQCDNRSSQHQDTSSFQDLDVQIYHCAQPHKHNACRDSNDNGSRQLSLTFAV
jgi:hypothetical protein